MLHSKALYAAIAVALGLYVDVVPRPDRVPPSMVRDTLSLINNGYSAPLADTMQHQNLHSGLRAAWAALRRQDFVIADRHSPLRGQTPLADPVACRNAHGHDDAVAVVDPLAGDSDHGLARGTALEAAIAALPRSGVRTVYLRGGVYRLRRPLVLTQAASDVALVACPGDTPVFEGEVGVPAMILEGSRNVLLAGLMFAGPASVQVLLNGARDCVVERNVFVHATAGVRLDHAVGNRVARNVVVGMAMTGIELKDASDANLVVDNVIDGADAPETSGGGIFLHGVRDNRIAHNLVQNTAGFGIGVSNWDDATVNSGNVVEYNLLRRTAQTSVDSGAIYVLGRSGADTQAVIAGNVIEGVGAADRHTVGIYLDDSTSGAVVTRNLVRAVGSDAVQIHGGRDNLIENNLIDLGGGRPSAILFQHAPADTNPPHAQTGNAVLRNVILSSNPSPRLFVWYDGGSPLVSGNFYAMPTGLVPNGLVSTSDAPVFDQKPVSGDPALAQIGARDDYAAVQQAASAIGFRPLDLDAAGVRAPVSAP